MTTVEKFRVGLEKGNPEGVVCKRQQIGVRAKLHSAPKEALELAQVRVAIVAEGHGRRGNISAREGAKRRPETPENELRVLCRFRRA